MSRDVAYFYTHNDTRTYPQKIASELVFPGAHALLVKLLWDPVYYWQLSYEALPPPAPIIIKKHYREEIEAFNRGFQSVTKCNRLNP